MTKKTILNRFLSYLLVIFIVLSVPICSYAETGNNSGSQGGTTNEGNSTNDDWKYSPQYWGIRFSLYWAPGEDFDAGVAEGTVIKIGKAIDVTKTGFGNYVPVKASMLSVFDRMTQESTMMSQNYLMKAGHGWSYKAYTPRDYSIIGELPNFINSAGDPTGLSESTLNTFFTGSATNTVSEMTFKNTASIIDMILKSANLTSSNLDFKAGMFDAGYGLTKGIFKLYYEPFYSVLVNGTATALTLRDMIAYDRENNRIFGNFFQAGVKLANSVYLVKGEPAINMKAYTGSEISTDIYSSGRLLRTIAVHGKTLYDSMGVGVVTGGII